MHALNCFPLYFNIPSHAALTEKVSTLPFSEREALEGALYTVAKKEGVEMEEDFLWGKNHLFDNNNQLIRALLQHLKNTVQQKARCSEEIADLVVQSSPFLNNIEWDCSIVEELVLRAQYLSQLNNLKNHLGSKYPDLNLFCIDSNPRIRAWKAQEAFFLTCPLFLSTKEQERFQYFVSVIEELVKGEYHITSTELILDKLLERESKRPSASHLDDHIRLLSVKRIAETQINGPGLNRADESLYKDIYIVPHNYDQQGKFKPLSLNEASKEVFAYCIDRILGIGMTAPSMVLKTKNLTISLESIQKLFRSAAASTNRTIVVGENERPELIFEKDTIGAKWLREKALSFFNSADIPQDVRNSIFGEMFNLCGDQQQIDRLGEDLFLGQREATDKHRLCAIGNYMQSDAFRDHQSKFRAFGSIQLWLNGCEKPYNYIVKDSNGGSKLKTAPPILVHFSALLGMIKGSMDCSSGNTLIQLDGSEGRFVNFWDMDDEKSMPMQNAYRHIRLWQMGLPQCAQPFNKAFLLLFSDPDLSEKLKKIQSSGYISDTAYQAQIQRFSQIIDLFRAELVKEEITLTPRELFFTLFGGKEEFDTIQNRFNNDPMYPSEEMRISAIEWFEFQVSEIGKDIGYTPDEEEKRTVEGNIRQLYA